MFPALFAISSDSSNSSASCVDQGMPGFAIPFGALNLHLNAVCLPIALAAAASLATLAVPNAAHALTWNWSFTTNDPSQSGSGTFTTADAVPSAGTTYQITGITGTYDRGGTSYAITSIDNNAINQFRWDGTPTSAILVDTFPSGIVFCETGGTLARLLNLTPTSFGPISDTLTDFPGSDGIITSSLLSPVTPQASVPGPLPLFGAGAAFGWCRRLRRRVKSSSLKVTSL